MKGFLKEYKISPDARAPGRTWIALLGRDQECVPVSLCRDQLRHLIAELSAASKKLEDAAAERRERNAIEDAIAL